ncbi:hypothetical protein CEXT_492151 [Caerostris extrusa]|uniref:Uncharacterized protein n=1 Tax=Caerostris extrusa TaxID=172846 RepID=A0AAV4Y038_CAEEX|nr:hypothetical protein CEXT_492151 [Caerostris extrusa]
MTETKLLPLRRRIATTATMHSSPAKNHLIPHPHPRSPTRGFPSEHFCSPSSHPRKSAEQENECFVTDRPSFPPNGSSPPSPSQLQRRRYRRREKKKKKNGRGNKVGNRGSERERRVTYDLSRNNNKAYHFYFLPSTLQAKSSFSRSFLCLLRVLNHLLC